MRLRDRGIILLSKTKNNGELFYDERLDTVYKLPYQPPEARAVMPPYMGVFLIAFLFGAPIAVVIPPVYSIILCILSALAMLWATESEQKWLRKYVKQGEKYRLKSMDASLLRTVYRLADRDLVGLYGTAERYTSVWFGLFIMSAVCQFFAEEHLNILAAGVMSLELGLYSLYHIGTRRRKKVLGKLAAAGAWGEEKENEEKL